MTYKGSCEWQCDTIEYRNNVNAYLSSFSMESYQARDGGLQWNSFKLNCR